jgi:hypothetical protein
MSSKQLAHQSAEAYAEGDYEHATAKRRAISERFPSKMEVAEP